MCVAGYWAYSHIRVVADHFARALAVVVHENDVLVDGHHHAATAEGRLHLRIRRDRIVAPHPKHPVRAVHVRDGHVLRGT